MSKIKDLAFKILGEHYTWMAIKRRNAQTYLYSVFHPYIYDPTRYPDSYLTADADFSFTEEFNKPVDRVIYIFWTGDNEITPNRMAGIRSMEEKCGVPVKLITPKNLPDFIVEEDPLPEAYQYLSYVHRADYLRSYFMYHYGGGYGDIKTYFHSWIKAFDKLDASKDAYVMGYPEVGFEGAANHDMPEGHLKQDLHFHWRYLIGNGSYICRPYTRFTAEWHAEAKRRLEQYSEMLKHHPAKDPFGKNTDYPIPWTGILGSIFHPLCLKYHKHLLKDKDLMPSFKNYR